jgi:transglutaminase-like putative cysteine protease
VLVTAGLPIALVLFLLFPRVEGPLFGAAAAAGSATTGLSDRMSPGDISDLGMSDEVAFRVDFEGTRVHPSELYWRGPVLWDFDGRTWRTSGHAAMQETDPVRGARTVNYRITLEPHRRRWLFALDAPAAAPVNATLGSDLLLRAEQPVRTRLRYAMRSNLEYRVGVEESERALRRALQLPPRFNPRTATLAARMRAQADTQVDLVKAALELFRREQFFYTLSPQALGRDSVDEFLFGTRRGFCEHYASAFVVLMRSAGVPARIVTGYQGGEHNRLGNYLVVRQSHAHAWAEVWLKGQGWVRVDPTAAVAPERVHTGSLALWIEQGRAGLEGAQGLSAWVHLGEILDHMTRAWNDWVLDYSPARQRSLLRDIGLGQASWPLIGAVMAVSLAIAAAIGAAMSLREWRRHPQDRIHRAYLRFCDKLARIGCVRQGHEGPCDFARRAIEAHPALAEPVERITKAYVRCRYAEGPAAPAQLEALVSAFSPERSLRQSGARY